MSVAGGPSSSRWSSTRSAPASTCRSPFCTSLRRPICPLPRVRNAGLGLGSLLAGVAVAIGGGGAYDVIVLMNAASFALAGWLIWITPVAGRATAPAPSSGAWRTVLTDRPYVALALANVAYTLSMVSLTILLPVYVVETLSLPAWLGGVVIALNCVLVTFGQGPTVRLIELRTTIWALRVSAALFSAAFVVLALVVSLPAVVAIPVLLAGVVVFTFGELFESPSMAALSTNAAPAALRGRYLTHAPDVMDDRLDHRAGAVHLAAVRAVGAALALPRGDGGSRCSHHPNGGPVVGPPTARPDQGRRPRDLSLVFGIGGAGSRGPSKPETSPNRSDSDSQSARACTISS
jgi:hypothetical protein